jgi:hypothetical protein
VLDRRTVLRALGVLGGSALTAGWVAGCTGGGGTTTPAPPNADPDGSVEADPTPPATLGDDAIRELAGGRLATLAALAQALAAGPPQSRAVRQMAAGHRRQAVAITGGSLPPVTEDAPAGGAVALVRRQRRTARALSALAATTSDAVLGVTIARAAAGTWTLAAAVAQERPDPLEPLQVRRLDVDAVPPPGTVDLAGNAGDNAAATGQAAYLAARAAVWACESALPFLAAEDDVDARLARQWQRAVAARWAEALVAAGEAIPDEPAAYVLPVQPRDPATGRRLLRVVADRSVQVVVGLLDSGAVQVRPALSEDLSVQAVLHARWGGPIAALPG